MKTILISGKAFSGKDSAANIIKEELEKQGKKVLIAHFGDLLKYVCKTFFNWNGEKDDYGRTLLQKIGTEKIRGKFPDFWVRFIRDILIIFDDEWDYVLISDTRFQNEALLLNDAITVRVTRLNFISPLTIEQQNHSSETSLDSFRFDYYLNSESGLDNLKIAVNEFLEWLGEFR
jgi:hypothetical protein